MDKNSIDRKVLRYNFLKKNIIRFDYDGMDDTELDQVISSISIELKKHDYTSRTVEHTLGSDTMNETKNIVKTATGAETEGKVIDVDSLVSMNMWGLTPDFLDVLEEGFKEFFEREVPGNPMKAEYLIPIFIGELLEQGKMSVKVLKTNDTWYGMTYHEDVAAVKGSFKEMLENGVYKADLFSNL